MSADSVFTNAIVQNPYELDLSITESADNLYDLNILINLEDGAWLAGPLKNDYWKGKFMLSLDPQDLISLKPKIEITPSAIETIDPFAKKPMTVIKTNSVIRYQISKETDKDFELYGYIQFVIEPKCTLEKIPFSISHYDGELHFNLAK